MAGAGYKLFNTGDVLTAAQVNTYLQEQVVMVFNDAASRTTALSGVLAEGMVSYLKSTKVVEIYNGTAWASLDDPNAIQNTIVDAKGDLIAATGNDVPARLAVGNNGETLVADSSATTGLRYNPQNALANPVINGGFDIWQRGTSFIGTAYNYSADRWVFARGAFAAGGTITRQNASDANLPNVQYAARLQRDSGNTNTNSLIFISALETANSIPLAGKAVTLSFYARKGANYSVTSSDMNTILYTGTGTDEGPGGIAGWTGVSSTSATQVLTTSWQRFTMNVTLASTVKQIGVYFTTGAFTGTAGANDWIEITGVQIDLGTYTASSAPTFRRSGGTLAGELAACQRYYQRINAAQAYYRFSIGMNVSATQASFVVPFRVSMRTTPTFAASGNFESVEGTSNRGTNAPTLSSDGNNTESALLYTTIASGTTGYAIQLRSANSTASYVEFSSEL